MATFPSYVKFEWRTAEEPAPVVLRSEMERGVAKQRRIAADTTVKQPLTLLFDSDAAATNFENWVYTDIGGGADWFDFTSPRTGGTVSARIVGGDIGRLEPAVRTWARSMRQITIEYVRAAL